jgi:Subtilisin inhibitor-like
MMMNMLRAGTGARPILIAAVCAAALSACGSVHATGGTAASAQPASKVSLVIQVAAKPGAKAHRWTLRCDPVGGTHPHPAAACHALLHAKRPFAPLPDHVMCPMIVAGTKTATISGTWFGKHIDSNFNQRGCGNLRWNKIGQVFN